MAKLMTVTETAELWNISTRRVQTLCAEGRIYGAQQIGKSWMIPVGASKPSDSRATRYKDDACTIPAKPSLTSIDLFAGPGGLATGFRWAGIQPLIAVEWSYWTVQTYAQSHNAEILELTRYEENPSVLDSYLHESERPIVIYGDINKVSAKLIKTLLKSRYGLDSVDVVTGGAPCESFSMAGDRKESDDLNQLYQNILRIAKAVDSKMFVFENVKGLFSKKHNGKPGEMYRAICDEFESAEFGSSTYRLASRDKDVVLLKAADYGVPQMRERLFLVGLNNKYANLEFSYPKATHGPGAGFPYVSVGDAVSDLPSIAAKQQSTAYKFDCSKVDVSTARGQFLRRMRGDLSMPPAHLDFEQTTLTSHKAPGHTNRMLGRIRLIKQGENMRTASERLISQGRDDLVAEFFPTRIYAARNRRLKPSEPSFTVTSHCLDEMIHPTANRGLSPREAARLQSFPDWYVFQGPHTTFHSDPEQDQYEQIGDAIPPLLAYAIAREIRRTLSEDKDNK